MKILVTGANGFLGARLARRLADDGHEVIAMVYTQSSSSEINHPNIAQFASDIRNRESLAAVMVGVEQIYHLAAISTDWAPDSRDFYHVNTIGTINLLEAARAAGVKKIVNTSSAGVIGPPDPENVYPVDENHVRNVNFFLDYESSKMMAEERVLRFVLEGMHIVIVSPTRVYGPGPLIRMNSYLVLINNYLTKRIVAYPGIKTQLANFVHADDVIEGHLLAMEKGRSGQRYLLGGSNVRFQDLFDTLQRLTNKKKTTFAIPIWGLRLAGRLSAIISRFNRKSPLVTRGWLKKITYSWPISSEKAIRELGYAPMDFETSIRKTMEWLEAERKAGRIK